MSGFHRLHSLRLENDAAGFAMDEMRPRFDSLAKRNENGTAPRAVSAYQLFQTPPEVAARLVALLGLKGSERVLEPSAGLGRLLDALPPSCDALAVEVAPQCAGELFRQGRRLLQRDFLTVHPSETGLFDAVLMNPPFHLRADIRHIQHARTFLKPGGKLAALCLSTRHRVELLKPLASQWLEVPEGAFAKEGTRVACYMLLIEGSSQ